jgi:hypothetical protein
MTPPRKLKLDARTARHLRFFTTVLALALMNSSAEAYTVAGLGNASCGTWAAVRREQRAVGYEQWVLGFLNGIGFKSVTASGGGDPLNGLDADAVWAWVDNYCQSHPLEAIWIAAVQLSLDHPR